MHRTLLAISTLGLLSACARPQIMQSPRTPAAAPIAPSHTVVFVHGMFVTPACWEEWEKYFQARGYKTLAPAWPEHDLPETARQAARDGKLGALTLEQVLQRYRDVIRGLGEKPILVGHSMGGLVVQLLLQEGLGAAGVAIDSAPPKGVISLKYSFLKANWPVISPSAKIDQPIEMSFPAFQYAFVNGMPLPEQRAAYERHVVPESRRVGKAPTTPVGAIDFSRPRPPLLLIAGGDDHIIPPGLNRSNYARYRKAPAITDFREFPGRNHWIIAQAGWQEVAGYVLDWIKNNQR